MNMIWAITMDIFVGVVVTSMRGSSIGIMVFVVDALGDAGSPYITGLVSGGLYSHYQSQEHHPDNLFHALQHAGFLTLLVATVGGVLYFVASLFIADDLKKAKGDATE